MGRAEFLRRFICVSRRNLKNPPAGVVELNQSQFDEVTNMCETIERQPAYQALADHDAQKIISAELPLGEHFIGLSAIPDWIKIDGDSVILTDLKTAQNGNDYKHHWNCFKYGYYRQFAVETIILNTLSEKPLDFTYRHLLIEKDPDGVNIPYAYIIDESRVNAEIDNLIDNILPAISSEKEFNPKSVSWENAITIGAQEEGW